MSVKPRVLTFGLVALALLVFPGADCGRRHWELRLLLSTHTAFAGDEVTILVTAEPAPAVGYSLEMDWGDTTELQSEAHRSDTFAVSHRWDSAGVYVIHAFGQTSAGWWPAWSEVETETVSVGGPHAPVVDSVLAPPIAVRGETTWFTVYAHDPEGDSIRAVVAWSDTTDTATSLFASPASIPLFHVFALVETARVLVNAQDRYGAVSPPETVYVLVGTVGGVPAYPEGPLDPLAPWPKWQHDLHNTGYVEGGR